MKGWGETQQIFCLLLWNFIVNVWPSDNFHRYFNDFYTMYTIQSNQTQSFLIGFEAEQIMSIEHIWQNKIDWRTTMSLIIANIVLITSTNT